MDLAEAQAHVRTIYSGGWGGPGVSALIWLDATITAYAMGMGAGSAVLFVGGAVLIFPINVGLNWPSTRGRHRSALLPVSPSGRREVLVIEPDLDSFACVRALHLTDALSAR